MPKKIKISYEELIIDKYCEWLSKNSEKIIMFDVLDAFYDFFSKVSVNTMKL